MLNRSLFLASALVGLALMAVHEWYAQKHHWPAGHDLENLDVWADQRARVSELDEKDVIILGSSRAHFNINIHR